MNHVLRGFVYSELALCVIFQMPDALPVPVICIFRRFTFFIALEHQGVGDEFSELGFDGLGGKGQAADLTRIGGR